MSIGRTHGTPGLEALKGIDSPDKANNEANIGESFGKILTDAHQLDQNATNQAERFAAHDPSVGIHEVVIASEKSNIAIRYAVTMKNKALEAYHELMNTQV
ncbi:MAG TPA: flagellar hook-basal body complex protein FliE [Kofleriaceae bacterium]